MLSLADIQVWLTALESEKKLQKLGTQRKERGHEALRAHPRQGPLRRTKMPKKRSGLHD